MTATRAVPVLRQRDGHHARVSFEELFFDLVYVFAVTQLAHLLLHHLSWVGAVEAPVRPVTGLPDVFAIAAIHAEIVGSILRTRKSFAA